MVFGKQVRLSRLLENGRMLCVPLDHGTSIGPVQGLEQIENLVYLLENAGVTAVLAHKGVFRGLKRPLKIGSIMHMSASTQLSSRYNRKVLVSSVEEAVRLGVDAVSVHINIGGADDDVMLEQLGETADACDEWQMPLIAMMYPRGENIKDASDPFTISHVARVGAELGADIVKTPMPSANIMDVE
ncbi:MAG: 2-amino-4,5-dihydroxy-6-one-heptanoic acid-7-phosphate synthase, partial [Candidatus Caldarchaeum sp.]